MGELFRSVDWAATPLGALETWPQSLRTAVGIMLCARDPMFIAWGPELLLLHNEGFRAMLGARAADPRQVLGRPLFEAWPAAREAVGPMLAAALAGESLWFDDREFKLARIGGAEHASASVSASPVHAEGDQVAGVLCVWRENTAKVRSQEERLRLLDAIVEATRLSDEPRAIMEHSTRLLGQYLDATRVAYANVEADNDRFTIRHDWRVAGAVSTVGEYSLDLFGSRATSNLRLGRTLLINDVDRELTVDDGAAMFNQIGIKAIICCPLVKQGRLVAMMAVHQQQPRAWTADEVALVEDVVERCWAHIERVRSMEALREADRRKSEFIATLAHELRNPLAPIRNALELMRLHGGRPGMLERLRATMERQVGHMVHLIDDLLDIARIANGKVDLRVERVDVHSVVASAVETSLPLVEPGRHQLQLDLSDEPLWIDADAVRLSQVLSNLLSNARKYTPQPGRITVSARGTGDEVVIEVADTGIGIAAKDLLVVFDMFSQAGHGSAVSKGGLGIGLALVRDLVTLHGGAVAASSPGAGQGSTFTIRLPRTGAGDTGPAQPPQPDSLRVPDGQPGLRVLVADDNVDAAQTLAFLLREKGHAVRVAHDGQEAVEVATVFVPDLAFLDLGMPRMDGYQAAHAMRALDGQRHLVLVALSGWGAQEDRARTRAAGFDEHLLKPASPASLDAVLASAALQSSRRC